MKANEIRIGNYVDCVNKRHNEKYIEIESVTCEKINVGFREYSLSDCKPIPLTEDWLSLWFVTCDGYAIRNFGQISFVIAEGNECDFIVLFQSNLHEKYFEIALINYVHQLQNIYFALTGEELTLT